MQIVGPIFHIFDARTHFSTHNFSKVCFPLLWQAHFRKTSFSTSDQTHNSFAPWKASRRALFAHLACSCRSSGRSDRYVSAFEPFGILIFAHNLCIFSLRSPVSSNDCIHHTCKFMNFVCHLLLSLYFYCRIRPPLYNIAFFSWKTIPTLGGKHKFESGRNAKS